MHDKGDSEDKVKRLELGIYGGVRDIAESKDIDSRLRCVVVIGSLHIAGLAAMGVAHQANLIPYAAVVASLLIQTVGVMLIRGTNVTKERARHDPAESGDSG